MGYFLLALAVLGNAGGNILLKIAAGKGALLNPYLIGGIALFALNVLFYAAALRALPLSTAYPLIVGMTFLIVSAAAAYFLGEAFTVWHMVGYILIFLGVLSVSVLGAA